VPICLRFAVFWFDAQWELPLEQTSLLVAVVSTTGNGDAPDNMEKFHRYLKKKTHPADMLSK
jgi:sulfite reductase alpha subunit-like flavoprotein